MKFELNDQNYQLRVQRREVVIADVMRHGELVASGEAILNPADAFDMDKAHNIAVGRALKTLPVGMEGHGRVQKEIVKKLRYRELGKITWDTAWLNAPVGGALALSVPATRSTSPGGAYTTSDGLGNAVRDYLYDGKHIQSVQYHHPTTRWDKFKAWLRRARRDRDVLS